jgi:hypothetical protein
MIWEKRVEDSRRGQMAIVVKTLYIARPFGLFLNTSCLSGNQLPAQPIAWREGT